MATKILLRDIGEKFFLNVIRGLLPCFDDSFFQQLSFEGTLLLSSDTIREGVHFLPELFGWERIGKLIVSVTLSDIAAMGGKPRFFMLNVCCSEELEADDLYELILGCVEGCESYSTLYCGGDLGRSEKLMLAGFCVGEAKKPIKRSGAKPGDAVFVTGELGSASLALEMIRRGEEPPEKLLKKLTEPRARVEEGLRASSCATSMTDISDSLALSLYELAESSEVGFEIDLNALPLPSVPKFSKQDLLEHALYGGSDYELLLTAPPEAEKELKGFRRIGKVVESGLIGKLEEGVWEIKRVGWDSFGRL